MQIVETVFQLSVSVSNQSKMQKSNLAKRKFNKFEKRKNKKLNNNAEIAILNYSSEACPQKWRKYCCFAKNCFFKHWPFFCLNKCWLNLINSTSKPANKVPFAKDSSLTGALRHIYLGYECVASRRERESAKRTLCMQRKSERELEHFLKMLVCAGMTKRQKYWAYVLKG